MSLTQLFVTISPVSKLIGIIIKYKNNCRAAFIGFKMILTQLFVTICFKKRYSFCSKNYALLDFYLYNQEQVVINQDKCSKKASVSGGIS